MMKRERGNRRESDLEKKSERKSEKKNNLYFLFGSGKLKLTAAHSATVAASGLQRTQAKG